MADRSVTTAWMPRLLGAIVLLVVLGTPAQPAFASYIPVPPPATQSQVDPVEESAIGSTADDPAPGDESTQPAMARLSQTGIESGALALMGLALVAAGAAVVRLGRGRARSGWY